MRKTGLKKTSELGWNCSFKWHQTFILTNSELQTPTQMTPRSLLSSCPGKTHSCCFSPLLFSNEVICSDKVCMCVSGVSRMAVTVSWDQLWFGLERLWTQTSSPVQRKCWTAVTSASWYVCVCASYCCTVLLPNSLMYLHSLIIV